MSANPLAVVMTLSENVRNALLPVRSVRFGRLLELCLY